MTTEQLLKLVEVKALNETKRIQKEFLEKVAIQKGDRGDDGHTPEFGVDYFTEEHVNSVADYVYEFVKSQLIQQIYDSMPKAGDDFVTPAEMRLIKKEILDKIITVDSKIKDPETIDYESIVKLVYDTHISNINNTLDSISLEIGKVKLSVSDVSEELDLIYNDFEDIKVSNKTLNDALSILDNRTQFLINRPTTNSGGTAADITSDNSSFQVITGTDVQSNLDSIDLALQGRPVCVLDYGAVADGIIKETATITSGSTTVTCASASFTSSDIGKTIIIYGTNDFTNQFSHVSTISSINSSTSIVIASAPSYSSSTQNIIYGTDNSTAIAAAFSYAETVAQYVSKSDPNEPIGSNATVYFPAGVYITTQTIEIPNLCGLDCDGSLYNAKSARTSTDYFITTENQPTFGRVYAYSCWGGGVQIGVQNANGEQTHSYIDNIEVWNVKGVALTLNGYHHTVKRAFIKQAGTGIAHLKGSDCTVSYAELVGCDTGVTFSNSNQVRYPALFLDTCGGPSTEGGVVFNSTTTGYNSNISINLQAFVVAGVTSSIFSANSLVNFKGTNTNKHINIKIVGQANRTGGSLLTVNNIQECDITLNGTNLQSNIDGGATISTGAIFGSGNAGFNSIHLNLAGGITPYTGTILQGFTWYQSQIYYDSSGKVAFDRQVGSENLRLLGTTPLRFYDSDSSNYISVKAPNTVASNVFLTLPDNDGSLGGLLTTDGSGNTSWVGTGTSLSIFNVKDYGAVGNGVTNDSAAVATAFTAAAGNGILYFPKGTYLLNSALTIPDAANVHILGAGKDLTTLKFGNLTSSCIVKSSPTTRRFKYQFSDFTIDNQSKSNAGAIGIDMQRLANCTIRDLVITNCAKAVKISDDSFINSFNNIDIEECTYGFELIAGSNDTPNENAFYKIKFAKSSGGDGVDYPLTITDGNDNHFIACSFEDFLTAIHIEDIGNSFTNNRIECNDRTGTITYVEITADGKNNTFVNNYYSGNEWVDRTTSILDSGEGNSFIENNTFKDQWVNSSRNLTTAGDYVTYTRTGSGDAKAVVTASDTYSASGTPTQFLAKGVRALSKFFAGQISGVEKFFVNQYGIKVSGTVDNTWMPNMQGFKGWNYDPVAAVNTTVPTGGTIYLNRLYVMEDTVVTHAYINVSTAGSGTTNAYVAIYNSSGTLIATSNDNSSNMNSTGMKTFTFASPPTLSAGQYYRFGFWITASTTVASITRASSTSALNGLQTSSTFRFSTADTGLTTTAPSSLGSITQSNLAFWVAFD